jgi:hypothetical protein
MKDEEYISELCILAIEGIQNKKDRVELFYQEAEMSFPYEDYLNNTFNRVLAFLQPISQELSHSRWSNKTDFYTLFYSLCKKQDNLTLNEDLRSSILNALLEFSNNVNGFLDLENDESEAYPQYIIDYSKGVRAATDYSARTNRQNALDDFLSQYFH